MMLGMTIIVSCLVLSVAPPLPHAQFWAEEPEATLTASSGYRLHFALVYGADSPTPTPIPTTTLPSDFEQRVIELVNQERTSREIAPLTTSGALMDAAREHNEDMAYNDFLDHIGSDDSTPGQRISRAGYDWSLCGENIAAGYSTPEDVVAGWMNSDDHCANMLNPDFCDVGVGYAYNADATFGHYWTQNLAAPR